MSRECPPRTLVPGVSHGHSGGAALREPRWAAAKSGTGVTPGEKRALLQAALDALASALGRWDLPAVLDLSDVQLRAADALDATTRLASVTGAGADLEVSTIPDIAEVGSDVAVPLRLEYRYRISGAPEGATFSSTITGSRWRWDGRRWLLHDYEENGAWQHRRVCLHPTGALDLARAMVQPLSYKHLGNDHVLYAVALRNRRPTDCTFQFLADGRPFGDPMEVQGFRFKLARVVVEARQAPLAVRITGGLRKKEYPVAMGVPSGHPGAVDWCPGDIAALRLLAKLNEGFGASFAPLFS